jgi:hypothetical protein
MRKHLEPVGAGNGGKRNAGVGHPNGQRGWRLYGYHQGYDEMSAWPPAASILDTTAAAEAALP